MASWLESLFPNMPAANANVAPRAVAPSYAGIPAYSGPPPANDQANIAQLSAKVSTPDFIEMHRQDMDASARLQQQLRALQQLQTGRGPMNYDEAQLTQKGLAEQIQRTTYALNEAKRDIAARGAEIMRRNGPVGVTLNSMPMMAPPMVGHPVGLRQREQAILSRFENDN